MSRVAFVGQAIRSSLGIAIALGVTAIASLPSQTLAQTAPANAPSSNPQPQSGCISGYPDGTFRGDRPVTRYEFAAGLNACLNNIEQQIPTNRANLATKADFRALIERQRELNAQVKDLSSRVDGISTKTMTRPRQPLRHGPKL
ncbi:S-layer homology domain-containing protein [Trichocoleus desertorum]|uniref:S-layer homology domain-containing protein n=1 Tax=Trichocoleus desertorum TaxID=1481672 RepID=UPI001688DF36|nr:S-layer homology domain-containing protein [Trichocoleus sp. FACHB-46]